MNEVETKALKMLRTLHKLGVRLQGCGCCGSNEINLDGEIYEVLGGDALDNAYHYTFINRKNNTSFVLFSDGKDENVLI